MLLCDYIVFWERHRQVPELGADEILTSDGRVALRGLHIRDKVPRGYQNAVQAHRVAWRIIKNAIEAQMAIFMSQQGDIAEVFLPYAIDDSGTSFYRAFTNTRIKALGAGSP